MLGTEVYPITLAEMATYAKDADDLFSIDEHEELKGFLAVNPESGDVIPGTGGVRQLLWPIQADGSEKQIIYYFRDLNMPLYLLAVYAKGEHVEFIDGLEIEVEKLVCELVDEHSKRWSRTVGK